MITINFRLPHGNTENFEQKVCCLYKGWCFSSRRRWRKQGNNTSLQRAIGNSEVRRSKYATEKRFKVSRTNKD